MNAGACFFLSEGVAWVCAQELAVICVHLPMMGSGCCERRGTCIFLSEGVAWVCAQELDVVRVHCPCWAQAASLSWLL